MEEIAFNDWPGQPVDLNSGGNSWLPAYGFQPPPTLFEREDFLGNPDAEYFLQGNPAPYLYLETIHEETSDDLRSDSDISRGSPLGWLASDSETDSVICMETTNDSDECESDREIACPIKRRRQDPTLTLPEEDYQSLSRSSSLLQFETLEKQCQETSSSSPSISSQFDSLERAKKLNRKSGSDSSDTGDSETTLTSKSCSNLKSWHSFDSLPNNASNKKEKISAENLSEDSGYSDHMCKTKPEMRKTRNFPAYDYQVSSKFIGNLGVSCQNLSVFEEEELSDWLRSTNVNLEKSPECRTAKYNSASEPNLHQGDEHSRRQSFSVCVCSVPKDLEIVTITNDSIAAKNFDLGDLKGEEMSSYKREGSYAEAMSNRVDLSDDEGTKKTVKSTIVEFDKKILRTISESIHSINSSQTLADAYLTSLYSPRIASTPNLAGSPQELEKTIIERFLEDERRKSVQDLPRKSSLVNHSTSTSCVSETLSESTKGVHFSPVISEVNWRSLSSPSSRDSGSISSGSPERDVDRLAKVLLQQRSPSPPPRFSGSQPELNPRPRAQNLRASFSQSDVRMKRRASQLVKKDVDGTVIKAYVDNDGIQYKHTHLDLDNVYGEPAVPSEVKSHVAAVRNVGIKSSDAVAGMEAPRKDHKTRAGGKLGGFFSRLASFRFSNKKDEKKKKRDAKKTEVQSTPQKVASKEDYIYIPLKGPPIDTTPRPSPNINNNHPPKESLVSKPPLPRVPPRVVGASVKRGETAQGRNDHEQHRRRRTIDSGESCPRPMEPMGLIETDLDTEVTVITSGPNVKTRSLLNLGAEPRLGALRPDAASDGQHDFPKGRPHKSMEFLLDKQNLKVVEPPENELQKGERVMSEHQLRVQRSLQKLNVPDWYKHHQVPREGFLLKKQSNRESRWTGTGSRTTSLSSLGSNTSPVVLSPTANQPFVRWSTSKLNSTASSPCASTRSSFNARQHNGSLSPSSVRSSFNYRQPYMGWRSQERLSKPRTPAERLTNSLLTNRQNQEIQSSIKEVTSAIVHYVSGLKPDDDSGSQRSHSTSPRGSQKLCWLESSFVGIRPLDSPQTPVTLSENQSPVPPTSLRLDLQKHNGESIHA